MPLFPEDTNYRRPKKFSRHDTDWVDRMPEQFRPSEPMDRLIAALNARRITVFAFVASSYVLSAAAVCWRRFGWKVPGTHSMKAGTNQQPIL